MCQLNIDFEGDIEGLQTSVSLDSDDWMEQSIPCFPSPVHNGNTHVHRGARKKEQHSSVPSHWDEFS